jgi:hypothetical protein
MCTAQNLVSAVGAIDCLYLQTEQIIVIIILLLLLFNGRSVLTNIFFDVDIYTG